MAPARYAQHFLVDEDAIHKIVRCLELKPNEPVLEIGPGRGALTKHLVKESQHVVAVEVDSKMVEFLRSTIQPQNHLTLHHQDFLKVDLEKFPLSYKVVGNLPYNLTSPILRRLSEWNHWSFAVVMVQKEVGDRLCASVGSSDYGALTVGVSLTCECQPLLDLPEEAFRPRPRVKSKVVRLTKRATPLTENVLLTQKIIQAAFQQRRKTILNSLSHGLKKEKKVVREWLKKSSIKETDRAENVTADQYVFLAKIYRV